MHLSSMLTTCTNLLNDTAENVGFEQQKTLPAFEAVHPTAFCKSHMHLGVDIKEDITFFK